MSSEIVSLSHRRMLSAQRRMAALVVERLSKIRCDEHGRTALAVADVDDEGIRCYRYIEGPCCPAHAALLDVTRGQIERELYESTGYLRALLIANDESE